MESVFLPDGVILICKICKNVLKSIPCNCIPVNVKIPTIKLNCCDNIHNFNQ